MTTYIDNFTRGDGPIGNAPTGAPYDQVGTWTIDSHTAHGPTSGSCFAVFDAAVADVEVSTTILDYDSSGTRAAGVVARWTDATQFFRLMLLGFTVYLIKDGGGDVRATWPAPAANGVLSLRAVGNVYTASFNGTALGTHTDTGNSYLTVTRHGLYNEGSVGYHYDDLTVDQVLPAPPAAGVLHTRLTLGAVTVPESTVRAFVLAPIVRAPVAFGPIVTQPDTITPPIVAHVLHPDNPTTIVATLDQAHSLRWLDQLNEAGSGSIVLQNDDPDLAAIVDGDLIRFEHYGYAAMCVIAQDITRVELAEGEEHDQTTTITGPGHLALLEQSRVYPARGVGSLPTEDDRYFAWSSPDYDDTAWGTATTIAVQHDSSIYWSGLPAETWPNGFAEWIWASVGTQQWAPPGTCYFRHTFSVDNDSRIIIYLTCDDAAELYVDGQNMVGTGNGFADPTEIRTVTFDITAGEHVVAIQGTNTTDDPSLPPETHNPAGVLATAYLVDPLGRVQPDAVFATDGTWLIVEYPPGPPGMTPTEVVRHVVTEGQARGELPGITLMFSDETDSAGEPVPLADGIGTKTGTDLLAFIRELTTYLDVWMAPGGLELWAWNKDGRGSDTGVSFEPGVNLAALTHQRLATPTNALLVRWAGGWTEVTDTASIAAHGRQGGLLGLGAAQTVEEAQRIATEQFATFADPREALTVDLVPVDDTDRPYPGFLIGDTVTAPLRDTPTSERVIALTVAQDDDGQVSYVPELHDVILAAQERHEQALKKMADGTMRGDSVVATPVSAISTGTTPPNCCPPQPEKP